MASNAAEAADGPNDGSQKSAGTPVLSSQQSPRNASSSSATGTVAAAGAGTGMVSPTAGNNGNNCPYVQMGSIEVPKALQDGEKFIKWDEVSLAGGGIGVCNDAPNMAVRRRRRRFAQVVVGGEGWC